MRIHAKLYQTGHGHNRPGSNRCIEDKTEEYSSQQVWSSIGEQYPERLTGGGGVFGQARCDRNSRQEVNPRNQATQKD